VALIRVDTIDLFPEVRGALRSLLLGLDDRGWVQPTSCGDWTVRDVAAHLVGVDLGNVARRRDGHRFPLPPGGLEEFNEQWVIASRRLSTQVLLELGDLAGHGFEGWLATVDLDEVGEAPSWAGGGPAPRWLDVAREYTERWVHQQQIRAAVGEPGLDNDRYVTPVIATFAHALPVALRGVEAPPGSIAVFRVTGVGGGKWHLVRSESGWDLREGDRDGALAILTTDAGDSWRRMTNQAAIPAPALEGDPLVGAALAGAVAIMV